MASQGKGEDGRRRTLCCRLCMSMYSSKTPMIVDAIGEPLLVEKIYACVNVKIRADDKYSTMVCTPCINLINTWYAYKQACLHNQMKLEEDLHYFERSQEIAELKDPSYSDTVAAYGEISPSSSTPRNQLNDGMETGKEESSASDQNNEIPGANNTQDNHTTHTHRQTMAGSDMSTDSYMSPLEMSSMTEELREQCSEEKRDFLAKHLKLVARNITPVEPPGSLTKIEKSYIDKCTAMGKMYRTLKCACHRTSHPDLRTLFTHLRNSPLGFPSFTCYNCMITFPDRSSRTRHHSECRKSKLETLIKLSKLRQRSEIKTRIYQNYKCSDCGQMYSFHEDFCAHVDEFHCQSFAQPLRCNCDRVFTSFEDYKSHAYTSCLIEYYCDICFISVKTLDDFRKHAAGCHDASEGFPIFLANNCTRRGPRSKSAPSSSAKKKIYSKEGASPDNIFQAKRVRRASVYQLREMKGYAENEDVNGTNPPNPIFHSTSKNRVSTRKRKTADTLVVPKKTVVSTASVRKHVNSKKSPQRKRYLKRQTSSDMSQLNAEMETHKNIPLLSSKNEAAIVMCDICDTTFATKEELKKHKLTHEIKPVLEPSIYVDRKVPKAPKRQDCEFCDKSYTSKGSFWKHTRKFHPDTKPITYCELCQKEFYSTRPYNRHKAAHQKIDSSLGSVGRSVRERDSTLGAGYSSVLKRKTVPARDTVPNLTQNEADVEAPCIYTCGVCIETFSSKYYFAKHKRKHPQEHCKFCKMSFAMSYELDNHVKQKHQPDIPVVQYSCKQCPKVYTNRFAFSAHTQSHKYSSVVKQTGTPKAKKIKLDVARPATPSLKCEQCKAIVSSDIAMQTHVLEKHGNVDASALPARCSSCNSDFPNQDEYERHKRLHTISQKSSDRTNFTCKERSASSTRSDDLDIHRRQFHNSDDQNVRECKCTLCDRVFDKQYFLDIHLMVHQSQKLKVSKSRQTSAPATC